MMTKMRRIAMFKLFSTQRRQQEFCRSKLFNNETFYRTFMCDLTAARRNVIIESPFITSRRIETLLPVIAKLRRKGVSIIVNTRCPEEHEDDYIQQAYDAIQAMQEIGVTVLYTTRHHRKLAGVDNVLWEGSLNILSYSDSCEVMRRIESKEAADEMLRFTGVIKYVG
jgi:hypothetical protein